MNATLTKITKLMLNIMYFGGMLVCLALPAMFHFYSKVNYRFEIYYWPMLIIFWISGVLAILLIGELRKMFDTVLADDCFVEGNVVSLQKMGTYSFIIAAVTFCRAFLYITPAVLVIILVFVIAGLFSKVLAGVFDKAVTYKIENDLTI